LTAAALVAIDWGTTSARAYRVTAGGEVVESRSAALGVSHVTDARFDEALWQLLGDWRYERAPRIASGMIGSRQGWVEAPYVACPAPLTALADGLVHTPNGELAIVPGAKTRDAYEVPDVMRGEETQLVGGVDHGEERVLVALPGTHSKWACVESGRIVDFMTFMTGEMWSVMLSHSILGRLSSSPGTGPSPGPAFARGVARGLGHGSLAHDAFGARTLALMGELGGDEVADWLSGLMIGREVRNARTWAHRQGYDGGRVRLIGSDALVARYAEALAHADVIVERARPHAAALGLWRIAVQAGIAIPSPTRDPA
jgi:2-dehydro-3-deoxygalactonokinase